MGWDLLFVLLSPLMLQLLCSMLGSRPQALTVLTIVLGCRQLFCISNATWTERLGLLLLHMFVPMPGKYLSDKAFSRCDTCTVYPAGLLLFFGMYGHRNVESGMPKLSWVNSSA